MRYPTQQRCMQLVHTPFAHTPFVHTPLVPFTSIPFTSTPHIPPPQRTSDLAPHCQWTHAFAQLMQSIQHWQFCVHGVALASRSVSVHSQSVWVHFDLAHDDDQGFLEVRSCCTSG